jgi:hypothetical protein
MVKRDISPPLWKLSSKTEFRSATRERAYCTPPLVDLELTNKLPASVRYEACTKGPEQIRGDSPLAYTLMSRGESK